VLRELLFTTISSNSLLNGIIICLDTTIIIFYYYHFTLIFLYHIYIYIYIYIFPTKYISLSKYILDIYFLLLAHMWICIYITHVDHHTYIYIYNTCIYIYIYITVKYIHVYLHTNLVPKYVTCEHTHLIIIFSNPYFCITHFCTHSFIHPLPLTHIKISFCNTHLLSLYNITHLSLSQACSTTHTHTFTS